MREIFAKGSAAVEMAVRTPKARERYRGRYRALAEAIPEYGLHEHTLQLYGAVPRRGLKMRDVFQAVGRTTTILSADEDTAGMTIGLRRSVRFIRAGSKF